MTVPRDWANPLSGVDLKVQISRVAATGASLGAILVNPGGPSVPGTSLAPNPLRDRTQEFISRANSQR